MHEHWAAFGPPVYIAVAAYLGLNKPKEPEQDLGDLMAMFAGSGGRI
jgi:hypothetical protein